MTRTAPSSDPPEDAEPEPIRVPLSMPIEIVRTRPAEIPGVRSRLHRPSAVGHDLGKFSPIAVVGRLALVRRHPVDRALAYLDLAERAAVAADRDLDVDVPDGNRFGDVE